MEAFYYCVCPCARPIYRHIGIGIIRRAAAADRTKKIMVGCSTVIALLLCLSLLVLSLLGLPVTTEARTHVVFSSSPDMIGGDRYIPPPREKGSGRSWKRTITALRRPPIVPRSPVGGTNKPYVRLPPPPIEI